MTAVNGDLLTAALEAHRAGLAVVPPREDGTKAPDGPWRDYQTSRPDPAQIHAWYSSNGRARHGLGVLTGAASGHLEMLELEGRAAHLWPPFVAACNEAGLQELLDRIVAGYAELTPSGGVHLLYRSDQPVDGNRKLARDPHGQVLLETRGEGGYVIVAPSSGPTHPTGQPWVLRSGRFATIATITAGQRAQLLAVAASFDQQPNEGPPERRRAEVKPGGQGLHSGESWMDDVQAAYNTATTWAQILEPHGWQHSHRHGQVDYWTRPGKEPREGHSATTNANGTDRLIVFSSSVTGFDTADGNGPPASYDRFGATAVLDHSGDRTDAARALRDAGYGPAQQTDVLTRIGARKTTTPPPDAPWGAPVPLDGGRGPLPGFPLDVLPDWLAEQATDVAHQLQVPPDLPALLGLGAIAAVCHGKYRVRAADGWAEHINLYLAVAMPPSSGKSPAAKAMLRPVEAIETELLKTHQTVAAEAAQRKRIAEKRAKDAETRAAKSGSRHDVDDAVQLFIAAEAQTAPPAPRLLSDDATPEALTAVLADNGGRITIASTEGGLFEMMTGRYSDGRANLDVYLKAWSSDSIRVDRIGRPPVHIPEPVVTVALAVQPDVLRALAERPELAGRGLTARFMYSLPVDLVGTRDLTRPRDASRTIRARYDDHVTELGRTASSWTLPADLHLEADAGALYGTWRQNLELRRRPDGDLRAVAEWTGKLEATVLRLAGILHVADGASHRPPVAAGTMARAIRVGEYWLEHALAVHDLWGGDQETDDAAAIITWAAAKGLAGGFKGRQAALGVNRFRDDPVRLTAALAHLEETGWLRPDDGAPIKPDRGSGRVAQVYLLHPNVERAFRAHLRASNTCSTEQPSTERAVTRGEGTSEQDRKGR